MTRISVAGSSPSNQLGNQLAKANPFRKSETKINEANNKESQAILEDVKLNLVKELCANVPDLIMYREAMAGYTDQKNQSNIMKFNGVLMFADVSGFTALTERYTMKGDAGVDRLTSTLNKYMGSIVQCILESGGDVLKFAGDAFLALWKVPERQDLKQAITVASRAALTIQDRCDRYMTDIGIELRVKLAISAGNIFVNIVESKDDAEMMESEKHNTENMTRPCTAETGMADSGASRNESIHFKQSVMDQTKNAKKNRRRHFYESGRPVSEVNKAEKLTNPGKIVLSPNAWDLCDKNVLTGKHLGNRYYELDYLKTKETVEPIAPNCIQDVFQTEKFPQNSVLRKAFHLKPDIHDLEKNAREFVMQVVQNKLEDQQPLRYLSEMRQVTVVFINLAFRQKLQDKKFYEKQAPYIQRAFEIIDFEIMRLRGTVNKLFMFDKGCSVLAVFGLPGSKHDGETAHALQASWRIDKQLKQELSNLEMVSIGVTTGPVFVGVMGHKDRHEYTIIGPRVNMAARLMMNYPKMISCDTETAEQAKLAPWLYKELPFRPLKGIGNPGKMFQYSESYGEECEYFLGTIDIKEPKYPILGRDDVLQEFNEELFELTKDNGHKSRRVILIEGEPGIGKTRFLNEVSFSVNESNHIAVFATITITERNKNYSVVKMCIYLLLKLNLCETRKERQTKLIELVEKYGNQDENGNIVINNLESDLHLLNDVLGLSFPTPAGYNKFSDPNHDKNVRNVIRDLVKIARIENEKKSAAIVFCLDDVHHVDPASWNILTALAKDRKALIVCTVRSDMERDCCPAAKAIFQHPFTKHMRLFAISSYYLPGMICQMLDVHQVSKTVKKLVHDKSHGVPFWVEQILKEMEKMNLITMKPVKFQHSVSRVKNKHVICPEKRQLFIRNPEHDDKMGFTEAPIKMSIRLQSEQIPINLGFQKPEADKGNAGVLSSGSALGGGLLGGNLKSDRFHQQRVSVISAIMYVGNIFKSRTSNIAEENENSVATSKGRESSKNNNKIAQSGSRSSKKSSFAQSSQFFHSKTSFASAASHTSFYEKDDQGNPIYECILNPSSEVSVDEFSIPISIVGICIAKIDQMSPFKQMIVKCAGILGDEFSIKMLQKLMPNKLVTPKAQRKYEKAIGELVADGIFEKAGDESVKILKFTNPLFQKIAGAIWLDSQAIDLHRTAMQYLIDQLAAIENDMPFDNSIAENLKALKGKSRENANYDLHQNDSSDALEVEMKLLGKTQKSRSLDLDGDVVSQSCSNSSGESFSSISSHGNHDFSQGKPKVAGKKHHGVEKEHLFESHDQSFRRSHGVINLQEPVKHQWDFMCRELKKYCDEIENEFDKDNEKSGDSGSGPKISTFSHKVDYADLEKENSGEIPKQVGSNGTTGSKTSVDDFEGLADSIYQKFKRNESDEHKINNINHLFEDCYRYDHNKYSILARIYTQITFHCHKAQDTKLALYYMTRCAQTLNRANYPHAALEFAKDAIQTIGQLREGIDEIGNPGGADDDNDFFDDDDERIAPTAIYQPTIFEEAEAFATSGQVYFNIGNNRMAYKCFSRVLEIFNCGILKSKWFSKKTKSSSSVNLHGDITPSDSTLVGFKNQSGCVPPLCFGAKKLSDIVQEKMLLSRSLGFMYLLFNDFNALTKVDDNPTSMSMKQLLKLSNQLVDTQFSEISSIIGKLETDSHHSYFVHLLLAQSYLNKYQTGLLSKSINNSQFENENVHNSNLQKAVIACRRLARIEDFGLPESFKQNISRSTLANQIMMAVCSNSFYYKNLTTAENLFKKTLVMSARSYNYDSISVILPILVQIFIHQVRYNEAKELLIIMYKTALKGKNSGIFAWYRTLNLSVILDTGMSFIDIDDTMELLSDTEDKHAVFSKTAQMFAQSTVALFHSRRCLSRFENQKKYPSATNTMKWRDSLQLAYRNINRGLVCVADVAESMNQNFFRIKSMMYVWEAMITINKTVENHVDEDLSPKILNMAACLKEFTLSNSCPILYPRFLILMSWTNLYIIDRTNKITARNNEEIYYKIAQDLATKQGNLLDAEWAQLLRSLHNKEFTFMRMKTSGHPSNTNEWLGQVLVNCKEQSVKNDNPPYSDLLRDQAPIHFFPFCPYL